MKPPQEFAIASQTLVLKLCGDAKSAVVSHVLRTKATYLPDHFVAGRFERASISPQDLIFNGKCVHGSNICDRFDCNANRSRECTRMFCREFPYGS